MPLEQKRVTIFIISVAHKAATGQHSILNSGREMLQRGNKQWRNKNRNHNRISVSEFAVKQWEPNSKFVVSSFYILLAFLFCKHEFCKTLILNRRDRNWKQWEEIRGKKERQEEWCTRTIEPENLFFFLSFCCSVSLNIALLFLCSSHPMLGLAPGRG